MAWVGPVLSAAGAVMGAAGQQQAAAAQSQAAEYNAKMTQMQGQAEVERIQRESAREQARLRSAIGKSGVTTAGTPLMVMAESEAAAELDVLNTRWSTDRQVDLYKMQSKSAKTAGSIGAGSSLLSGAGRLYG